MLLIGQPRCGKTSTLMQLATQLPNADVVIVNCQRAISGTGDKAFAAEMSAAINHECPGRRSLAPLKIEEVGKHPLHELNIWLEQYADSARGKRILLCLDEFDKLVKFVAKGHLTPDVLSLLRGLSSDPSFLLLYCAQFELDDWAPQYAEYIKNVHRMRISYLRPDEARSLVSEPMSEIGLTWQPNAIEAVLHWTGCHPYLLQILGTQVVDSFSGSKRGTITASSINAIIPSILLSVRSYAQSLQEVFSTEENDALQQIAQTGKTDAAPNLLHRLMDREYIKKDRQNEWQLSVPLLREWWCSIDLNKLD